jgi:hypothetical protein
MRMVRGVAAALAVIAVSAAGARAQLDPRGDWRTLTTEHFRVHFTPALEEQGRRAAANAERAYAILARELTPPRGPIDVVLADNVDFSNGSATVFPTNRIVLYAQPPVDVSSLRFYDDWNQLLLTHELTHIFHIDRSRGLWRAAQYILGRNPALFPNTYSPSWLTEGLAVYFESRVTGAGRVAGSEHRMIARSAAVQDRVPRIDQFSLESSVFPGGQHAYAYGSLLVDYLASASDSGAVGRFVERASGQLVPYRLNRAARATFGQSFDDAWRAWRDSLRLSVAASGIGANGAARDRWRDLTSEGWFAAYPRWRPDGQLVYAANDGRSMPAAIGVDAGGGRERLGRRNSLSPNVPLLDGGLLFSQLEYVDQFSVRGDLYVERDGRVERLTHGARLAHPDANVAGAIVAVQTVPATTRLVLVSRDGRRIVPVTRATLDTQYAEPRWAPDGVRMAAVQLVRGGQSAIVVLDSAGRMLGEVVRDRAVNAAPSWSPDGRAVYYTSDRTGTPEIYVSDVPAEGAPPSAPRRLSDIVTGLFQPVVSGDGSTLAALVYRVDGFHLAVRPLDGAAMQLADVASYYAQRSRVTAVERDTAPLTPYAPWRTLLPRYWLPLLGEADDARTQVGAATSGVDVLRRHSYAVQALVNTGNGDLESSGSYRYARLGQPLLDVSGSQIWEYFGIPVQRAGGERDTLPLGRRTRLASLGAVFTRPRYRTSTTLSAGAQIEARAYDTPVASLSDTLAARFGTTFPSVFVSAAWSNTQRPSRSISAEDGVALSASAQQRWQQGTVGSQARRVVGVARAYKSLDLPGFAHHVLAVRVAGGVADRNSTSDFSAGGASGSRLELLPGLALGEPQRTFGVRGFAPSTQRGLRAAAASLEYRAPLTMPARGLRLIPFFVDRLSAAAFVDVGSAWCPPGGDEAVGCAEGSVASPSRPTWLASAGGELNLDAALQYDVPYRFRLGVAAPLVERERAGRPVSVYFTLGAAF